MTNSSRPSRLARIVEADDDRLAFVTPSWSRPDLTHGQVVCRRTGRVACSCEDFRYRTPRPHLLDLLRGRPVACKHLRGLALAYRRRLGS